MLVVFIILVVVGLAYYIQKWSRVSNLPDYNNPSPQEWLVEITHYEVDKHNASS